MLNTTEKLNLLVAITVFGVGLLFVSLIFHLMRPSDNEREKHQLLLAWRDGLAIAGGVLVVLFGSAAGMYWYVKHSSSSSSSSGIQGTEESTDDGPTELVHLQSYSINP